MRLKSKGKFCKLKVFFLLWLIFNIYIKTFSFFVFFINKNWIVLTLYNSINCVVCPILCILYIWILQHSFFSSFGLHLTTIIWTFIKMCSIMYSTTWSSVFQLYNKTKRKRTSRQTKETFTLFDRYVDWLITPDSRYL